MKRLRCLICARTLDEAGDLFRIPRPWPRQSSFYFLCGDHLVEAVDRHILALTQAAPKT